MNIKAPVSRCFLCTSMYISTLVTGEMSGFKRLKSGLSEFLIISLSALCKICDEAETVRVGVVLTTNPAGEGTQICNFAVFAVN